MAAMIFSAPPQFGQVSMSMLIAVKSGRAAPSRHAVRETIRKRCMVAGFRTTAR
jgi:hypothetical protein